MDMNHQSTLPLFPLPMLILPGETTALHLFEPRYLEMLKGCLAKPNPTGDFVIAYQEGGRSPEQGCAVVVRKVVRENDDGTRDILVEGKRTVRLLARFQVHAYDSVRAEDMFPHGEDWDEELATRVYALHRQLIVACTGDEPPDAFYQRREQLSFAVAACSGFTVEEKQRLLAFSTENERLDYVRGHLETVLPFLQRAIPMWKEIVSAHTLAQIIRTEGGGY